MSNKLPRKWKLRPEAVITLSGAKNSGYSFKNILMGFYKRVQNDFNTDFNSKHL